MLKKLFPALTIIGLVTVLTILTAWVRLEMVTLGYEIHELERKERLLREVCNTLSLQINEAKSPQRLEYLAKHKFKMRPATSNEFVLVK